MFSDFKKDLSLFGSLPGALTINSTLNAIMFFFLFFNKHANALPAAVVRGLLVLIFDYVYHLQTW